MLTPRRLIFAMIALFGAIIAADALFPPPIEQTSDISVLVTDREGRPLRAFATPDGRWRFAARLEETDPEFLAALLRVEDKRFYQHRGTDWLGLARAGFDSAKAGRVVSGGSTITMQTARLLEPRQRNLGSKLIEIVRAWQIERAPDKGRNPRTLSDPCPIWRKPGGRAGGQLELFRDMRPTVCQMTKSRC